ncbi:hypothetical protein E6O75_ATG10828 [Venturia nashicola]|uniref:Uncharacterized protein n=1 Tax=Venturia nashicola TaxID=86259 RepID=A0A4Z1PJC3_9PEZI|nr:hypothetical protein E6O75_ATG10828 [Venturia nashicola]
MTTFCTTTLPSFSADEASEQDAATRKYQQAHQLLEDWEEFRRYSQADYCSTSKLYKHVKSDSEVDDGCEHEGWIIKIAKESIEQAPELRNCMDATTGALNGG